jgi:hypothetical protein
MTFFVAPSSPTFSIPVFQGGPSQLGAFDLIVPVVPQDSLPDVVKSLQDQITERQREFAEAKASLKKAKAEGEASLLPVTKRLTAIKEILEALVDAGDIESGESDSFQGLLFSSGLQGSDSGTVEEDDSSSDHDSSSYPWKP